MIQLQVPTGNEVNLGVFLLDGARDRLLVTGLSCDWNGEVRAWELSALV